MASPVSYDFEPGAIVWHITDNAGIKKATVTHVTILESTSETVTYHLLYSDDSSVGSTVNTPTTVLFAEASLGLALDAYGLILDPTYVP